MKLFRKTDDAPFDVLRQGSVATIGTYDGLHLGHQKLLDHLIAESKSSGLPSVVMSFEPTPQEYFFPQNPPARLMRFGEKFQALEDYGIDLFYCPHFDEEMRNIEPDAFIRRILVQLLNVRHLVIGDDFHFARNRSGSMEDLVRASTALEFDIWHIPSIDHDGERVSSTAVRRALAAGDLDRASALLGKRYRMSGKVVEGNHLGRRLGFPTANINPDRRQVALMGIFAARVTGLGDDPLDGVASLGTRPTVDGTKPLLEVHIFDFDEDIYDEHIHVEFVEKLRDEEKFADLDALTEQMHVDAAQARDILAKNAGA
ncbi:MAG: bifunctional riboflavin kinase/FAD synthetase [Woeseia sp.]